MNRASYFNYIEEKLTTLATRINIKGKLNVLDLHNHSEDFYLHFFNTLFNYSLENLNSNLQNVEAIDLIDKTNKLYIQVSATSTKEKIESSLSKGSLVNYSGYRFYFISISKDASDLRSKKYSNPNSIDFDPAKNIYDTITILSIIKTKNIQEQKIIYNFIKNELGNETDTMKLESNLASIIDILSKEDWDNKEGINVTNYFEIERKITFNDLDIVKSVIEDYKIYYSRLEKIYYEFNKQGKNKSSSVLQTIGKEYIKNQKELSSDDLFLKVIDAVIEKTQNSMNYQPIPIDELELCVNILVVDAFIRCKIFKNPENYNYVTT